MLHPTHVVIATSGEKRPTAVLSLPLTQASMVRGSGVAARVTAALPGAEDGLTIGGFPGHEGQPGTYYVGLGTDAAAAECARALEAAIIDAKNAA